MASVKSWQELKRRASYHYYGLKASGLRSRKVEEQSGTTLVAGLLSSPNGIGKGARLIRDGLIELGYNVASVDLTPSIQPALSVIPVPDTPHDDGKGPVILHLNPTEVPKALHMLRSYNLQNRRLIGVWAWELEQVPSVFYQCAQFFDEIWSISQFSQQSFQTLPIPVVNMGYPIPYSERPKSLDWRAKLGLAEEYLVLTSFDSRSSLSRKNPKGAVEAFSKAFPKDENVKLIVKVSGDLTSNDEALLQASNIIVLDDDLNEAEMTDLIRSCDCYLSLTRAEGFGLGAAEAAAHGVPTLITGWSSPSEWAECPNVFLIDYKLTATQDFHKVYDNIEGRRWADPSVEHAVELLKTVASHDIDEKQVLSAQARAWWKENYGNHTFEDRLTTSTRTSMVKI